MEEYFTTANLQMIVSRPLAVISSGSPGPAPTRKTFPVGLSTFLRSINFFLTSWTFIHPDKISFAGFK